MLSQMTLIPSTVTPIPCTLLPGCLKYWLTPFLATTTHFGSSVSHFLTSLYTSKHLHSLPSFLSYKINEPFWSFRWNFTRSNSPGFALPLPYPSSFLVCTLGIYKLPYFSYSCCHYHTGAQKILQFSPYLFTSLEGMSLHTSSQLLRARSPGRLGPAPTF